MDKLEQYLDQLCRSIGGPKSLRQHVRQELREHLLDAAAEHQAAGLSEADALTRAIADFGRPDEVRSELEATHGHRLLPVVIDKALQWKEMTMKAKWLWTTAVHAVLTIIIVIQLLLLSFVGVALVPKFKKVWNDVGPIRGVDASTVYWFHRLVDFPNWLGGHLWWIIVTPIVLVWGWFEWRVRSENKTLMRLTGMGTLALGLMVVVFLAIGSQIVLWALLAPEAMVATRHKTQLVLTGDIDAAIVSIEQSIEQKDWEAMRARAARAKHALDVMQRTERWNKNLDPSQEAMRMVEEAIKEKNAEALKTAPLKFKGAFEPVRAWVMR